MVGGRGGGVTQAGRYRGVYHGSRGRGGLKSGSGDDSQDLRYVSGVLDRASRARHPGHVTSATTLAAESHLAILPRPAKGQVIKWASKPAILAGSTRGDFHAEIVKEWSRWESAKSS